jgi:hypothetical protein
VGAKDCQCSRDQRLNVPSEARRSLVINVWSLPITAQRSLTAAIARRTDRRTIELLIDRTYGAAIAAPLGYD